MLSLAQIMVTVFALGLGAHPVLAEQAEPGFPPKFTLNDVTLVYDTESAGADEPAGITSDDVENLLKILRSDEFIRQLQINSSGGSVYAAQQISDIIIDFGLDTHVHGDCDSSCVTIFLAGKKRTMSRGSRIDFHQIFWSAENIASYYDRERGEQGWATPYDFAAWMYLDTQDEMYAHLKYITSRGVDPGFAIETIRNPQSEMWRPYRAELLKAGVLTE